MMYRHRSLFLGSLAGLLAIVSLLTLVPQAQSRDFKRPRGNSSTGAVRGDCTAVQPGLKNRTLQALVGNKSTQFESPTLTTKAYPTFWLYSPFIKTEDVTTATFVLRDENEKSVLKQESLKLSLPDKAGIVSFTLPTTEAPLVVGKNYYWELSVICTEDSPSGNPKVSGWLQRVAPSKALASQLKSTPPQNHAGIYAANNMPFERIDVLAQYRKQQTLAWTNWLNSLGLKDFAQVPVAEFKPQPNL
jgi:Domain of Unknown Function (DUF928)